MIIQSAETYLPQLISIWKSVFKDSDDYIRLFFDFKYVHDETLLYVENNRVQAMVFFPSYDIKLHNHVYKAGYICGAATLPEYRNKGIMPLLLNEAEILMRNRGDACSVLIPANLGLFEYYSKFGYCDVFRKGTNEYDCKAIIGDKEAVDIHETNDVMKIVTLYNEIIAKHDIAVMQNFQTYNVVMKVQKVLGGGTLIISQDKMKVGFLFCKYYDDTRTLQVKEIMIKRDVISCVAKRLMTMYDAQRVVLEGIAGSGLSNIKRAGMIKMLNQMEDIDISKSFPYMNMMLD